MTEQYLNLLSEPTLVFQSKETVFDKSPDGSKRGSGIFGLILDRADPDARDLSLEHATAALELYIRRMVEACAQRVRLPAYGRSMWASPQRLKSLLSPSSRKRLQFVDRRHSIWTAVEQYLRPVWRDVAKLGAPLHEQPPVHSVQSVAWDFYLLSLATRYHCEVPILPDSTLRRPGVGPR